MGALKDLWQSERGLVAIAIIAATTVLFALGKLTEAMWLEQTKWVFVTYAAAKTITSSVAIAKGPPATDPPASTPPAIVASPVES